MVSSVRPRPNHYDVLGLAPTANDCEIGRAFAKKMGLASFHPPSELARILLAFETLRDPARRRDYDRLLAAPPKLRLHQWTAAAQPRRMPFMAGAATSSVTQGGTGNGQVPEPKPDVPAEKPTTAIGRSLRELAKAEPVGASDWAAKHKQEPDDRQGTDARLEQVVEHILAVGRAEKEKSRHLQIGGFDWRRPLLALGGLVVGAGLFGALLGLSVRENASSAQAETTSATPLGRALRHAAAPPAEPLHAPLEAQAGPPALSARLVSGTGHKVPRRPTLVPVVTVEQTAPVASVSDDGATATNADGPAAAKAVAAALPLPTRLVAHTLERIGYACGQVAATAPAEGEAQGVYEVTCSSGQTYVARPVHGRYRFRRVDR